MTGPGRSPAAWAVMLGTTAFGLAVDLASKYIAFQNIAPSPVTVDRGEVLAAQKAGIALSRLIPRHDPITVIPGVLEFTLVLNPGAVFGIGAGKRWFFVGFTLVALALAIWMFLSWTRSRDRVAHAALGLLISGGLGNLYDRVIYACVRDFIHPLPGLRIGSWEVWPYVSNVADLFLIIGVLLLMVHLWRTDAPAKVAGRVPT